MRRAAAVLAAGLLAATGAAAAQPECDRKALLQPGPCAGDEMDDRERELARLINEYRRENGLPAVPLSRALGVVANRHVRDLALHRGEGHDWSDCPVHGPQGRAECMWEAPQRLGTGYRGAGYENAMWGFDGNLAAVLDLWKERGERERPHNDVILNRKDWKDTPWRALGVGIHEGHVVMWVGGEPDPTPLRSRADPPR